MLLIRRERTRRARTASILGGGRRIGNGNILPRGRPSPAAAAHLLVRALLPTREESTRRERE